MGTQIPRTIEELKSFAAERQIPLEKLHVYLGTDYQWPKAFGIYKDGEEFIVYKNKADGSRAIRYRGKDEAYAVREIYLKMREMGIVAKGSEATRGMEDTGAETSRQDGIYSGTGWQDGSSYTAAEYERDHAAMGSRSKSRLKKVLTGCALAAAGIAIIGMISGDTKPKYRRGYYNYQDEYYYSDGYDWYCYNNGYWLSVGLSVVDEIIDEYAAYAVDISDAGIEPCYVSSYDSDDDDDDWWDDDDDWYDDNDWDYDFDNDWDWDSDW